jgi:hypothetical protein
MENKKALQQNQKQEGDGSFAAIAFFAIIKSKKGLREELTFKLSFWPISFGSCFKHVVLGLISNAPKL